MTREPDHEKKILLTSCILARCCADSAVRTFLNSQASSCKSCEDNELQNLFFYPVNATSNVCSATSVSDSGQCSSAAVFEAAARSCDALGGRLCTSEELLAGIWQADTSCLTVNNTDLWSRSTGSCATNEAEVVKAGTNLSTCQAITSTANYVCCADSISATRKSDDSCLEHQLAIQNFVNTVGTNGWVNAQDGVCAASQIAYDYKRNLLPVAGAQRCQRNMSWEQAEQTCAVNAARLCSQHELLTRAATTGCLFRVEFAFSNQPCTTLNVTNGRLMVQAADGATRCVASDDIQSDGVLRCCADSVVSPKQTSALTCSELGFVKQDRGDSTICGSSVLNGSCNTDKVARGASWDVVNSHFVIGSI
jgi:hypothetical protein